MLFKDLVFKAFMSLCMCQVWVWLVCGCLWRLYAGIWYPRAGSEQVLSTRVISAAPSNKWILMRLSRFNINSGLKELRATGMGRNFSLMRVPTRRCSSPRQHLPLTLTTQERALSHGASIRRASAVSKANGCEKNKSQVSLCPDTTPHHHLWEHRWGGGISTL